MKPKNSIDWSCDKPIQDGKVPKNAKCKITCQHEYEAKSGKNNA